MGSWNLLLFLAGKPCSSHEQNPRLNAIPPPPISPSQTANQITSQIPCGVTCSRLRELILGLGLTVSLGAGRLAVEYDVGKLSLKLRGVRSREAVPASILTGTLVAMVGVWSSFYILMISPCLRELRTASNSRKLGTKAP